MKYYFWSLLVITLYLNSFSQDYIDVSKLPQPDCEYTLHKDFDNTRKKIFVMADNVADSIEYQRMISYWKDGDIPLRNFKYESELQDSDYENALIIFGPIKNFNNWEKFRLPIKQTKDGFEFDKRLFEKTDDGMYILYEKTKAYIANSLKTIWNLQTTSCGKYQYTILRNHEIAEWGQITNDSFKIDFNEIRKINYEKYTSIFFEIYISKKAKLDEIIIDEEVMSLDSSVYRTCKLLDLKQPDFKIKSYVHSNPNEGIFMANFYHMFGCDKVSENESFGTVLINETHSTHFNRGLIRHESFHVICERLVGFTSNSFFSEGIQKYYEIFTSNKTYENDLLTANKYLGYRKFKGLIKDGESFWDTPIENGMPISYPISGLFTKFLIDNWGLDKYKILYKTIDKEKGFEEIFNLTMKQVINDYKKWILKKATE